MWRFRTSSDEIVSADEYELRVRVLRSGTRSEGRVGRLYRSGVEVRGGAVGERIVVGEVTFVYCGEERPRLWSVSGWTVEHQRDAHR